LQYLFRDWIAGVVQDGLLFRGGRYETVETVQNIARANIANAKLFSVARFAVEPKLSTAGVTPQGANSGNLGIQRYGL